MAQARQTPTLRPPTVSTPTPAAHDVELIDDLDALLDEIDTVLEENAWVTDYRQKGGQ